MASALKTIVSKNKRRHVEDGFNLDLSYINDRIIAMGFPAEKVESIYRNSLDEVKRFLEQKHANHYFIYNLCSERFYDPKKFHGRVSTYPFDDHHPPDFSTIRPFCDDVESWLSQDPRNVAVVHCKAGKGRTGVMICCYLLHSGKFKSAEEVLKFYGQQRTVDQKGVTIPSQRRYINYYGSVVRDNLEYKPVKLYLRSLVLDPVPNFNFNISEFYVQFDVRQANKNKFESIDYLVRRAGRQVQLVLNPPLLVCGDIKIEFSSKLKLEILPKTRSKEFHFWFNTFFVDSFFSSNLCHSVEACNPPDRDNGHKADLESKVSVEDPSPSAAANGGSHHRILGHMMLRPPVPERHSSCIGGGTASADVEEEIGLSNLLKHSSISDDHLTQSRSSAAAPSNHQSKMVTSTTSAATQQSFSERRTRHSSVPQTAKSTGTLPSHVAHRSAQLAPAPLNMPGVPVSMRLERSQIDKVAKDKTNKYAENFAVSLFMFRPDDQSDAGTYSSSPSCLASTKVGSSSKSSPDSSSEEETTDSEAISSSASTNQVQSKGDGQSLGLRHHHALHAATTRTTSALVQSGWI